jgi:hypothetical protein
MGVNPTLGETVVIVREPAIDIECSAVIPSNWTYKRVLHDYVSIRMFAVHEAGEFAMTYEVHDNGVQVFPETRCLGRRTGRKNSLKFCTHNTTWVKVLRQGKPDLKRKIQPWGGGAKKKAKVDKE